MKAIETTMPASDTIMNSLIMPVIIFIIEVHEFTTICDRGSIPCLELHCHSTSGCKHAHCRSGYNGLLSNKPGILPR